MKNKLLQFLTLIAFAFVTFVRAQTEILPSDADVLRRGSISLEPANGRHGFNEPDGRDVPGNDEK